MTHPEFDRYEEFQAKSAEELLEVALGRLEAGAAKRVVEAFRESGVSLILPLNASLPNNAMKPTR